MDIKTAEQPIVTLSVSVTPRAYRQFFFHWMSHHHKRYWVLLVLCLFLVALFLALNLWLLKDSSLGLASTWLFLFVFQIQLFYPGHFYYRHREMYRSKSHYAFYDAHFHSSCDVAGTRHYKAIPYQQCTAVEAKSAFYLYRAAKRVRPPYGGDIVDPDPYNANAILDKEQLTPEQQQALRELFTRKFGDNFKQYKQK